MTRSALEGLHRAGNIARRWVGGCDIVGEAFSCSPIASVWRYMVAMFSIDQGLISQAVSYRGSATGTNKPGKARFWPWLESF